MKPSGAAAAALAGQRQYSIAGAARRRVLHCLTEKVRGGIEEHALSILTALREHGFEPHLAAPAQLLEQMSGDLRSARVATLTIENPSLLSRKSVSRFRRYLATHRIDIVHTHTFRASVFASP